MWNSSERKIDARTVLIILSVLLVIAGVGFVIFINRSLATRTAQSEVTPQAATLVADNSVIVPVSEISTIIKPCLFVVMNSCAKTIGADKAIDLNPAADPTLNTSDESFAQQDIFNAISNTPNKGLANYQVAIDGQTVETYFPEYKKDASASAVSISAPIVIARVATKHDVNPRVLLVLMEILNGGSGPLFSGTIDFSTPYFTDKPGFVTQLATVASDLQGEKTKYTLMQQEGGRFPSTVNYFGKDYTVSNANAETLALVDYLAQKLNSKKDFEKAIYAPAVDDKSGVNPGQNFDLLYKLIYSEDPR